MNKSKKILSVFLAVLMIMSCVPVVAFAADVETLTYSNVETWPTVTYKNPDGKMHFGQTLEQGLTINDDEVVKDSAGNQVEGYFVFSDLTKIPSAGENVKEAIKFIPADESKYSEFNVTKLRCKVYFNVETTTMIYDRENDPVVASEIQSGLALSNATLTGGKVSNPYNDSEPKIVAAKWEWLYPKTVITESGYHQAVIGPGGYEQIIEYVYVRIEGDTAPPSKLPISIDTLPTAESISYGTRLSSVTLTGGKVVIAGTTTEVTGTFKFTNNDLLPIGINKNLMITFVPDNTELYGEINGYVDVVVDYASINFSDETANKIVPELTMPYGTKLDDNFARTLAEYVNIGENVWIYYRDIDGNEYDYSGTTPGLGTHTYKVTAIPYNPSTSNYKATELEFKLTIEPLEVTPKFSVYGNDEYEITTGDYTKKPRGTYDLYVDGELVMEDINYQERFTWRPEKSGTYDLKAVYNPIENDTYKVNDVVLEDHVKNLTWKINCINCGAYDYKYGETAKVNHSLGNQFAGWVFYDENGNEFTPENVVADESTSSVKFTMPDFSLTVKAKIVGETDDSVDNDDNSGISIGENSIFGSFFEYLRSLFEKFINLIKTVIGMFNFAS